MKQERLTKLLENAKVKLEKANKSIIRLNKKLEQEKAEDSKFGIEWAERDIRVKIREIEELKKSIEGYNKQLKEVQSIEEIPVLREFINNWKVLATEYYTEEYQKLMKYKKYLKEQEKIFEEWIKETTGHQYYGSYTATKEIEDKRKELKIDHDSRKKYLNMNFDAVVLGLDKSGWKKQIDKIVNNEAERKYINFLNRIKKAVGKTLDCSGLHIADNLEINGIVKGELGSAKVETITAGGYNIQCYHYRVLVHML